MKKTAITISIISIILGALLFWNDMRYQRDVALVTADWCYRDNTTDRCRQWVENPKVVHWYLYGIK